MSSPVDRWAVLEILRAPCELERRRAARWLAAASWPAGVPFDPEVDVPPEVVAVAGEVLSALGLAAADGLVPCG